MANRYQVITVYRPSQSIGVVNSITLQYLGLKALVGCKEYKDAESC